MWTIGYVLIALWPLSCFNVSNYSYFAWLFDFANYYYYCKNDSMSNLLASFKG